MLFTVIGLLDFIVSLSLLLLNFLLFMTLSYHKEYNTGIYRIFRHMCVASTIQLIPFLIGGVVTMTGSPLNEHVERVSSE
uniref:G_PROTEIN_RECEP_F1_2 domain-containing protein n=1 Tax=Steinernema glaseri TaxID=37863 RepID=A0A1I8AUL2_9BILA